MEDCDFGRECGKFGYGEYRKFMKIPSSTPVAPWTTKPWSGFGPANTSAVDAMRNAGKR